MRYITILLTSFLLMSENAFSFEADEQNEVTKKYTLTIIIDGPGAVTFAGELCESTCQYQLYDGSFLNLMALAKEGHYFHGWSKKCQLKNICEFELTDNTILKASFADEPLEDLPTEPECPDVNDNVKLYDAIPSTPTRMQIQDGEVHSFKISSPAIFETILAGVVPFSRLMSVTHCPGSPEYLKTPISCFDSGEDFTRVTLSSRGRCPFENGKPYYLNIENGSYDPKTNEVRFGSCPGQSCHYILKQR